MSRYSAIRAFVCSADCGNFSAAARMLGTSPSNVSKIISQLENQIGVRLLNRSSRHTSLTEEGFAYLQTARRVVDAMTEHDSATETVGRRPRGTLRVNTMLTFAKYQLAPLLPDFLERYPLIRVQFRLSATFDRHAEDFDVALYSGDLPSSSLVTRSIGASRWIVCAAPSYLARFGTPKLPDELSGHRCLNFEGALKWNDWSFGKKSQVFKTEKKARVSSNQGELLLELARCGTGIVRLAEFHVERDIAAGRLVPILQDFTDRNREPIFAIYQSQRNLSPRVRVFLEYVQNRLKNRPWNRTNR